MFVDYYAVLGVDQEATTKEIKTAYRQQSFKWHPDKNPGEDTSRRMQLINEAYLILGDADARKRYDYEYGFYRESDSRQNGGGAGDYTASNEYDIRDEVLREWIQKAQAQSIQLAKDAVRDISGIAKESGIAAFDKVKFLILLYILIQVAYLILFP